jgi:hypothetical protein
MHPRSKFRCERIRQKNGVVEVFFSKRDGAGQDEHVLINIVAKPDKFEEGRDYWITIELAFPHGG